MASRFSTKLGLSIIGSSFLYVNSQSTLLKSESKRQFYEENTSPTVPGEPTEGAKLPKLIEDQKKTTSFLEDKIKAARLQLVDNLEKSKKVYLEGSEKYFKAEKRVTDRLTSLHDKREELFPNSLYVLTGLLSGLVLTRRKNFFVRATVPLVTGLIAFKVFLPSTFANTFSWLNSVEQEKLPSLFNKQNELIKNTESIIKDTEDLTSANAKRINSYYEKTKRTLAEYTGLNVDQEISEKKK